MCFFFALLFGTLLGQRAFPHSRSLSLLTAGVAPIRPARGRASGAVGRAGRGGEGGVRRPAAGRAAGEASKAGMVCACVVSYAIGQLACPGR